MKPFHTGTPSGLRRPKSWFVLIVVMAAAMLSQGCFAAKWLTRINKPSPEPTPQSTDVAAVILGPLYNGQDLSVHADAAGGFSVTYPAAWSAEPGREDDQSFIRIFGPDGQSSIYVNSADAGGTPGFESVNESELRSRVSASAEALLAVFGKGYSPESDLQSGVEQIGGKAFIRVAFHGNFPESGKRCAVTAWMGIYNGRLYLLSMVHPADAPEADAALLRAVATSLQLTVPVSTPPEPAATTASPAPQATGAGPATIRDDGYFFKLPNPAGWAADRKDYPDGEMDLRLTATDGKSYLSVFTGPMTKQDEEYARLDESSLRQIAQSYFAHFDDNAAALFTVEKDRKIDVQMAEDGAYIKADFYVTEKATGIKGIVSMRRTVANSRVYLVSLFVYDTCSGDDFSALLDAFDSFRVTKPRQ